ncbi:dihydroorotate dehydrogenase electron transfer subunit [Candidatus Bathyarchaeota archaeon]|nr:dihydroorotate dehydrogenase electron transfer subunit [Candidatus Bathyarchaeota archaeon]
MLSAYRIAINKLRTTQILDVKNESLTVKTFTFKDRECAKAKPGQFLMLWIPGVDEIPLSILDAGKDGSVSVVVKKVGEATGELHEKKIGETIGVRGPFGNSFSVNAGRILMVGGGTGIAPLFFLTKRLRRLAKRLVFVMGARTKDELLFKNELESTIDERHAEIAAVTEDGTCGVTGLCTEPLETILKSDEFDIVYACGPEPMIRRTFEMTEKQGIRLEASLERLMRCAIGLCGSCIVGRHRVCRDGPIFISEQIREFKDEFGISKRDFDGKTIPV